MAGKATELTFQNDMLKHLVANGWLPGAAEHCNRQLALYPDDLLVYSRLRSSPMYQILT